MLNLKRVLVSIVLIVLILSIVGFVLENRQSVSLLFLGLASPQLPVSIFIVLALLIGLILGPLIGWLSAHAFGARQKRTI
ncbi:DUF1049 domain-containing protein [Pseudomonas lurida]|uniref:lipopolysaccharide assembly protein LapA domain-containing protein n=1 Tax=Pseudomonas lurida TaxID=244566 RepID=UPI001649622E|nr:lipopolysaccharide assembly protein LapA domain-containing protein [Pseudomonas lurida]MBC3242151.1 DUF1049 domain-containing protein [Pseudomonas lurida]